MTEPPKITQAPKMSDWHWRFIGWANDKYLDNRLYRPLLRLALWLGRRQP